MAPQESFCRVTAGGVDYYLLTSEVTSEGDFDSLDLTLSDGQDVWCGQVTSDDLHGFSTKIHMDYENVLEQTQQALTLEKSSKVNFVYEIKQMGEKLRFMWKKHVPAEGIKFLLGSADLTSKHDAQIVMTKIFDYCISSVTSLREEISSLKSDNERLISERSKALQRVEKYVSAKEDIEQELYSKFVAVLNEKKAKLLELKENGDASVADDNITLGTSKKATTSSRSIANTAGSDSDEEQEGRDAGVNSDYNTDEDEVKPPVKKSRKIKEESLDTSPDLVLGAQVEDDGDAVAMATGKRRRRVGSGKKQTTPSRPVIPRVPSSEKQNKPGTSRQRSGRSSLQKASSVHSKSSDSIDAEDLMGDI